MEINETEPQPADASAIHYFYNQLIEALKANHAVMMVADNGYFRVLPQDEQPSGPYAYPTSIFGESDGNVHY